MLLLQTFLLLCLLGRHSKAAISTCRYPCNLSGEVSAFKVLAQLGTKGVACLHRAGNRAQDRGRKHLQLYGVSSLVNKVYAALAHLAKHTMLTFLLFAPSQILNAHVLCKTWLPVTGQHATCWRGNVQRDVCLSVLTFCSALRPSGSLQISGRPPDFRKCPTYLPKHTRVEYIFSDCRALEDMSASLSFIRVVSAVPILRPTRNSAAFPVPEFWETLGWSLGVVGPAPGRTT